MIFLGYLTAFGYGAICLLLSLVLYKLGMPKKFTRKLVHILVGAEWFILYGFFGAGWHTFAVCIAFLLLLVAAYVFKLMPMISSDSDNSPGTVYFAASMSAMALASVFLPALMLPFGVAVVCTSLGDGLAGVIGQAGFSKNPKILGEKTLYGTLTNFVCSTLGTLVFDIVFGLGIGVLGSLVIGIFATVCEFAVGKGLDNITLPLGVITLTYLIINVPEVYNYIAPIILIPLVVVFAINRGVLTPLATLAAAVLGIVASVAYKNAGFVILLSFLLFSIVSDKVKAKKLGKSDKKPRGVIQVAANGTAAIVTALVYIVMPREFFAAAFVAAMAEALSDTVSSGLGVLAKNTYDVGKFKKCEKGISGGVSLIGTVSSLVASALVASIALAFGTLSISYALLALGAGFLGSLVDSILGSLLQAKYKCHSCRKLVESSEHCGKPAELVSGFESIDNNTVNLVSNIFSAIIVIFVGMLI